MKIEENSIIQLLEKENTDVKQGAVIYLLTESFSILHHLFEMDPKERECQMLTEDLAELFISAKSYCIKNHIEWEDCKRKISDHKQNKEFELFMKSLDL